MERAGGFLAKREKEKKKGNTNCKANGSAPEPGCVKATSHLRRG